MKEETIEEVAEMYIQSKNPQWTPYHKQSFKDGAKWQQERMYSEEEVLEILFKSHNAENTSIVANTIMKWFEQFKKK